MAGETSRDSVARLRINRHKQHDAHPLSNTRVYLDTCPLTCKWFPSQHKHKLRSTTKNYNRHKSKKKRNLGTVKLKRQIDSSTNPQLQTVCDFILSYQHLHNSSRKKLCMWAYHGCQHRRAKYRCKCIHAEQK